MDQDCIKSAVGTKKRGCNYQMGEQKTHTNETLFDDRLEYFIRKLNLNSGNTRMKLRNGNMQFRGKTSGRVLFLSMELNYFRISNSLKELYWISFQW